MIRFLADENVPIKAVEALTQKNIDIIPILDISLGLSDRERARFVSTTKIINVVDEHMY